MTQPSPNLCTLCHTQFNITKRMPITVCPSSHRICLKCLQNLSFPFKCPFCNFGIKKENVSLDQTCFSKLGGQANTAIVFRYLYYREQLRITTANPELLENYQNEEQQMLHQKGLIISKNILNILTTIFIIFTVLNIIIHLCLVFTEEQQCIDWDQHPHSYTIRDYLKLNILLNVACFSFAALITISQNRDLKGFLELYGPKLLGIYIFCRLVSQIWMWSYFMFVMQPQCSTFIFLYLHIETFGYYLFAILYTPASIYYYLKNQHSKASQQ